MSNEKRRSVYEEVRVVVMFGKRKVQQLELITQFSCMKALAENDYFVFAPQES